MLGFFAHRRHRAHGTRRLANSKGNVMVLPNCTRKKSKKDFYLNYQKYCLQIGEICAPRDDFMHAGRVETMLDAFDSVDIKCGSDNIDAMNQFVDLITSEKFTKKEFINCEIEFIHLFMNTGLKRHNWRNLLVMVVVVVRWDIKITDISVRVCETPIR